MSGGETFIPYYTGRVIDILSHDFQHSEFTSAVLYMSLFSLGRYKTVFLSRLHPSNNFCCSETLTDLNSHLTSSVSAGCRGGLLLCAISAFTRKIKFKLFEALTKQEIGFFETVKTGKTLFRALRLHVNIEKDDTEGQRGSTELKMNTKEIKMQQNNTEYIYTVYVR